MKGLEGLTVAAKADNIQKYTNHSQKCNMHTYMKE